MKKISKKLMLVAVAIMMIPTMLTGCIMRPYDKPEYIEISPSQTAILLPLEGKTSEQGKFQSEEFLKQNLVASKRIQIPHVWQKTGRLQNDGKYVPTHRLIVVERKPITRNWTNDSGTGTSDKKEGVKAETLESIAFSANLNATGQIDEDKAVRFLYRYNGQSLENIMDTEIRSRIATKFVEECSKYKLADLLVNKQTIMESVRKDVIPYFADRGITITTIGISGDLDYTNPAIQESIDNKFKAEKDKETAQAKSDAIKIQASTLDQTLRLKEVELREKELNNQLEWVKKWNGQLSQYNGLSNSMIQIPSGK